MAVDGLEALLKVLTIACEWELTPPEQKALVERFAELLQPYGYRAATGASPPSSARGGKTGWLELPPAQKMSSVRKSLRGPELTNGKRTWRSAGSSSRSSSNDCHHASKNNQAPRRPRRQSSANLKNCDWPKPPCDRPNNPGGYLLYEEERDVWHVEIAASLGSLQSWFSASGICRQISI